MKLVIFEMKYWQYKTKRKEKLILVLLTIIHSNFINIYLNLLKEFIYMEDIIMILEFLMNFLSEIILK